MSLRLRFAERAIEQRAADPAAAERRLDRQRPEQQRRRVADADRQLPDRADQQRADAGGKGQLEQMIDMLAQPVCAQHETAGTEGAFVQTLDGLRVIGGLGQDGKGQIGHGRARDSICGWRGPSPAANMATDPVSGAR